MNPSVASQMNPTPIALSITPGTFYEHRIRLAMSYEPLQLTWLVSRDILSKRISQLIGRPINSIEITESLLTCSNFLDVTRDAYDYCMKYPTHTYFGIFSLSCISESLSEDFAFTAKAQSLAIGHDTYEIEIEISADETQCHMSDRYARFVQVKFQETYQQVLAMLSPREVDVLRLLGNGYTVKEAAKELYLSTHTIETHKQNIYRKLEIKSMAQLGKMAERLGLN